MIPDGVVVGDLIKRGNCKIFTKFLKWCTLLELQLVWLLVLLLGWSEFDKNNLVPFVQEINGWGLKNPPLGLLSVHWKNQFEDLDDVSKPTSYIDGKTVGVVVGVIVGRARIIELSFLVQSCNNFVGLTDDSPVGLAVGFLVGTFVGDAVGSTDACKQNQNLSTNFQKLSATKTHLQFLYT